MPATLARSRARTKPPEKRRDIYAEVTDRIVAMLEAGTVPWRKPWRASAGNNGGMPRNIATGRHYRGVNPLLLQMTALERGYSSAWWGTYRQISERGGQVRKGERGTLIVFWKQYLVDDAESETGKRHAFALRSYTVFNAQQCDGLAEFQPRELPENTEPVPDVVKSFDTSTAPYVATLGSLQHGGDEAYYRAETDHIQLPAPDTFDRPEEYCSTKAHELTHSTGHKTRLRRDVGTCRFGSQRYAAEELIAEMGAAMLAGTLGFELATLQNSAAYLHSWIQVLRGDSRLAIQAAAKAQKAVDLILGVTYDESED